MIEATVAVTQPSRDSTHLASFCEGAQSGARILDTLPAANHLLTLRRFPDQCALPGLDLRIMRQLNELVAKVVNITIN
jgi:hypothetical protein